MERPQTVNPKRPKSHTKPLNARGKIELKTERPAAYRCRESRRRRDKRVSGRPRRKVARGGPVIGIRLRQGFLRVGANWSYNRFQCLRVDVHAEKGFGNAPVNTWVVAHAQRGLERKRNRRRW